MSYYLIIKSTRSVKEGNKEDNKRQTVENKETKKKSSEKCMDRTGRDQLQRRMT